MCLIIMQQMTTVYDVIELYGPNYEINKCYGRRDIEMGFVVMCSATHKFVYIPHYMPVQPVAREQNVVHDTVLYCPRRQLK